MWSVSTILTGLLSFMVETQHTTGAAPGVTSADRVAAALWPGEAVGGACTGQPQAACRDCGRCCLTAVVCCCLTSPVTSPWPTRAGAISTPPAEKRKLARESLAYNVRNPTFRCAAPRPGS